MVPTPVSDTVVLYLHGVSQTRAYHHRVGLYKRLLNLGYTVLAVDYRGWADSSRDLEVTETSMVEDGTSALKFLIDVTAGRTVVVWGHSLGAPVAARVVA